MKRVGGIPVMALGREWDMGVRARGPYFGEGSLLVVRARKIEGVCVCLVHVEFGMNLGPGRNHCPRSSHTNGLCRQLFIF